MGIIFQYYASLDNILVVCVTVLLAITIISFQYSTLRFRFKYHWVQGILFNLLIFCAGVWLTFQKEIKNNPNWFGKYYTDSSAIVLKIAEPPTDKEKSFKTTASVLYISNKGETKKVNGLYCNTKIRRPNFDNRWVTKNKKWR